MRRRLAALLGALAALAPSAAGAHGLHAGDQEVPMVLLLGIAAAVGLGVARWAQRRRARDAEGGPEAEDFDQPAADPPSSRPSDRAPSTSRFVD